MNQETEQMIWTQKTLLTKIILKGKIPNNIEWKNKT